MKVNRCCTCLQSGVSKRTATLWFFDMPPFACLRLTYVPDPFHLSVFESSVVLTIKYLCSQIFLDRMTAETVSRFIEPFTDRKEEKYKNSSDWVEKLTRDMEMINRTKSQTAPEAIQGTIHSANSGRIYFEQLHLHPVRLSFTFTQEWMEWNPSPRSMMIVQFIRGMVSAQDVLDPLETVVFQSLISSENTGIDSKRPAYFYVLRRESRF